MKPQAVEYNLALVREPNDVSEMSACVNVSNVSFSKKDSDLNP